MKTRFDFLRELYLPGYMGLLTEDYDKRTAIFNFTPTEPHVFKAANYLTPRGAHIFISQAGLCLIENILVEEGFNMSVEEYRALTSEGRMKIVELNQKYRKELGLNRELQGRVDLTGIRWGKLPMVKLNFDIGEHAITGNLIGVLAPRPVPQTNSDILAINH